MRPNHRNPLLASLISLTLAAPSAFGVSLYWDSNGTTNGAGITPNGTWGSSAFWNTNSAGNTSTPTDVTTTGLDDLFFSAGTTATGTYTVSVSGSQTARLLTFQEGTATLSGGSSITLAGSGGITVLTGSGDPTISTALTLNGNNTFNVGTGRTLALDTGAFDRTTNRATLNVLSTGTVTSTKAGLATGDMVNDIIGPWASFGSGGSTTYAKFSGSNIAGLGYTGGADGTSVAAAANLTTSATTNFTFGGGAGTLGGNSFNTLRHTGTGGIMAGAFTTNGIMNVGGNQLTFSGAVTSGGTEMVLHAASGTMILNGLVTGTITKTGSSDVTLGGSVAHAIGGITVNQGKLTTNSSSSNTLPGATINSGGTLTWGANDKHANNAAFVINAGGTLEIGSRTELIGSINGAGTISGLTNGLLQLQGGTSVFTGTIGGTNVNFLLHKDGAANVTLSGLSTYTGKTTIERGTLNINSIANIGASSAIGAPALGFEVIAMGAESHTGTLVYTGTGHSSNRPIQIGTNSTTPLVGDTGGAAITANGAGNAALTFNAATFNTATNAATGTSPTRTLTLQGTSTGLNTISGTIQNNQIALAFTAPVALAKAESGTWVLSGTNTYTGGTSLSAGMLQFGKTVSMPASGAVAVTGGTLAVNLGGVGEWTTGTSGNGTLGGLLAGLGGQSGGTVTYAGNIALGIDTGNASPTTQTYAGVIPNVGTTLGITKLGTNTLALSNTNTYSGATVVRNGTLQLGINNAIPGGSAVIIGDAATPGALNMVGFTNSIGSLSFGSGGGTLKLAANQTGIAQLTASGAVALGSGNTLDLTGMSTGAGLYKLVSGSSLTGTFGTTTGLNGNYNLVYSGTSLDAQHKADQGLTLTTPASLSRALVSTNVSFSGTLTNTAPSGSSDLSVALGSTGALTVSSLASSTGSTVVVGTPSTITGSIATGGSTGTFGWNVRNTDANAITSPVDISGSINVVNQRSFSVGTPTIALGRFLAGAPSGTTAISSSGLNNVTANATLGGFSTVSGLTLTTADPTSFNGGSAGQTANYTVGGTASSVGSISGTFSSTVSAELGSISNVNVAVTGTALAARTVNAPTTTALGTFHAGATVNVTSNAFGYSYGSGGTGANSNTENTTVQAYSGSADANGITLSGGANSINSAATFTRTFTGTAAVSSSSGSFSSTVNPEFSGTTSVSAGYTIGVYSGLMVWSGGAGSFATGSNWTDSVSGGAQVAPGLDAGFTTTDTATFNGSGGTVALGGSNPSLNSITFANSNSYTISTTGGSITLAGTTPTITTTAGTHTLSALIAGSNGLTKAGSGTLNLAGANTYTGDTTVSAGTILINGNSSTAIGAVNVNAGTLGGTGTTGGAVTVANGATLAPGAGIESLAAASLVMASGSVFSYEVANNSSTGADLLALDGSLSLTGVSLNLDASTLAALSGGGWTIGNKLTLISYSGSAITSGFNSYADDSYNSFGSNFWIFDYNDTTAGNNFLADAVATRFVTLTYVPEPSTALLGALGLLALLRRRRN